MIEKILPLRAYESVDDGRLTILGKISKRDEKRIHAFKS